MVKNKGKGNAKHLDITLDENFDYDELLTAVRKNLIVNSLHNDGITHPSYPSVSYEPPNLSWYTEHHLVYKDWGITTMIKRDNGYLQAIRADSYTKEWYCMSKDLAKVLDGGVYIGFGENYFDMGGLEDTSIGFYALAKAIKYLDKRDLHKPNNANELNELKKNMSNVIVNIIEAARSTDIGDYASSKFALKIDEQLSEDFKLIIRSWKYSSRTRGRLLRFLGFNIKHVSDDDRMVKYCAGSSAILLSSSIEEISNEVDSILQMDVLGKKVVETIQAHRFPSQRYLALMDIMTINPEFFYKLLITHAEELLPIVYSPTVGEACKLYGNKFRHPVGSSINLLQKEKVGEALKTWPKDIKVIVICDGEQSLGFGDLGLQGRGIPVGKLTLCIAHGGILPEKCLAVSIDVGTETAILGNDSYTGLQKLRENNQVVELELIDEFMKEVKTCYGESVLVQFEDFSYDKAIRLLTKYEKTHLVFNDVIQGTACMVLAGLLGVSEFEKVSLAEQTFLFLGAGKDSTIIAELIARQIAHPGYIVEARKKMWLWDKKGLVVSSRIQNPNNSLETFTEPWAHDHEFFSGSIGFSKFVMELKPTVLIASPRMSKENIKKAVMAMDKYCKKPVIVTLAEFTKVEIQDMCKDAICLTRQMFYPTFDEPTIDEKMPNVRQVTNSYIFPGICLGLTRGGGSRVNEDILVAASEALFSNLTHDEYSEGLRFPSMRRIRDISIHISVKVAAKAFEIGSAKVVVTKEQLEKDMYNPNPEIEKIFPSRRANSHHERRRNN